MQNNVMKTAKNIIIGFIALVFLMGFFSKSIINLFLPKVQVAYAAQAPIERTLEVEGIIEAKKAQKIRLNADVIVAEYYVKAGDTVKAGDAIFRINTGYSAKDSFPDIKTLELELKREKLKLDNMARASFEVDKKDIALMETNLKRSNEELSKLNILFSTGTVAKHELDSLNAKIAEQEQQLEERSAQLETEKKDHQIAMIDAQINVERLQQQLEEASKGLSFYAKVDGDGIYYAETGGIVLNTNTPESILPRDSILAELAEINDTSSFIFAAFIKDTDSEMAPVSEEIEVKSDDNRSFDKVKITSISKVVDNQLIKIEGEYAEEVRSNLKLGQKRKGRIKKMYSENGCTIPRAAVIAADGFEAGKSGTVYLLEEKDGILGKEYFAEALEVKLLAVGDKDVIVSELEEEKKPRVITNLSYKIENKTRVFLWQ